MYISNGARTVRVVIKVTGIVQGVGFRPFIYRTATANHLKGYVRNRADAGVEIAVEGKQRDIDRFIGDLKTKTPPAARIHNMLVQFSEVDEGFTDFRILESSQTRELCGSTIPADIATCDACLSELRSPRDPRHDYFFITCTNCGPRYTTIQTLPYDRRNTTMQSFGMCQFCEEEYGDPANRRFHAQTTACSQCGPEAYLVTNRGEPVCEKDPIRKAGVLLEEGSVLGVKGYGGFHLATATTRDEPILRLRKAKHRSQKPFAIMARDVATIRRFAEISKSDAQVLSSLSRPIVLLDKSENYGLSSLIAPGLHNVGVFLPYTGMHVMLFDKVREPAFVMTSANPPSEPIVVDNDAALKELGSIVDYFLLHNRQIAQRCDDSVVRVIGENPAFIRRSRGYAPEPIALSRRFDHCVLGVGAEENVTACILVGDRAFVSQYIGDVENLSTLKYLKETIQHLGVLTNAKVDGVACDLHPQFATTLLARKLAEDIGCPIAEVQHHHAHMLSLMGEHSLDAIVGVVCDGYGYGADGQAWGGEVLHCQGQEFLRWGHLQEQPLLGGDLATRYPLRMAAGILKDHAGVEEWLQTSSARFPHGTQEVEILIRQLGEKTPSTTTSCGRVLDAVSAILGVCYERTYQGEPAIKLESAAIRGRSRYKVKPEVQEHILNTTRLVQAIYEARDKYPAADLAYSAQRYLAEGLAALAMEAAQETGVKAIGFSGGVAYNKHVVQVLRRSTEAAGFTFYVHHQLPPGDGGVSFGQALKLASST